MSLFKIRDCWSTACGRDGGGGETLFGCDALTVDDLFGGSEDNVIVGSYDGVLRVYGVHATSASDMRYSPSDLLIEAQTERPILQVCTGKMISCSPNKYVVVLHPFSIVVYGVNRIAGSADHGDQYVLETMYAHEFDRSAYQMVVGPFGGGSDSRDFVCVLSLDGAFFAYEQQAFGFRTALPDHLHPFPVKYVRSADAFVTLNADFCVVCYKYQELADPSVKQKRPIWSSNLGETVYDVRTVDTTRAATTIHVLGARNYYCLQGNGVLWFMKRLQYAPRCFCPYTVGEYPETKTMCMIVSDTDTVLIYEQTKLRWSAKLSHHPCVINRASFKALRGCMVLLSETGDLRLCYLGTDPMTFTAPERQTDGHKDTKNQLVRLKNDLQNLSTEDVTDATPLLKLGSRISKVHNDGAIKSCDIEVDVIPSLAIATVQIVLQADTAFVVSPKVIHLKDLTDSTTVRATTRVDDVDYSVATSMGCTICAYYSRSSSADVPGAVQNVTRLPLSLAFDAVCPTPKALDFSWSSTISVSESPAPLGILFKEFGQSTSLSEMCFRTVKTSKFVWISALPANSTYEIRSAGPECANVIFEEILTRHTEYYKNKKCTLRCNKNEMPVAELYRTIEEHMALKGKLEFVQEEIASLSSQYRIIQKCLFNKLKENTVNSVSGLNVLIDDTHDTLTEKTFEIVLVQRELRVKFSELMSLARLLVTMLGLCSKNQQALEEFKATVIYSAGYQDWEDIVLKSLSHLVGNEIMLNVQSDDPAHMIVSLRTLIDFSIRLITSEKDEIFENLKREENSRGAVSPIQESEEDFYN